MKSFTGKMIAVIAGFMMVSSVAFANGWENSSNADAGQNQTQSDETNLYNHHGDSVGSQTQNGWGVINTYGNASGSYSYYQDQQDSYDETRPSINGLGLTRHSGYSNNYTYVSGDTQDWYYSGSHSDSSANTDSGSSTYTSDRGPGTMTSDMTQRSNASVNGYSNTSWYGSSNNTASANAYQEDSYINHRENANTRTIHEGSAVQNVHVDGRAGTTDWYGWGYYNASASAVQNSDTYTNQDHGSNWDSMNGSQNATSVDTTNNSNNHSYDYWWGYGNAYSGSAANVGQIQTHSYEMESYNPSSNSHQYSTGTVTTGTGYDPTERK